MTNIIEISQVDLWGSLWDLFLLFVAPWVVVFAGYHGIKVILRVFKRVGGKG